MACILYSVSSRVERLSLRFALLLFVSGLCHFQFDLTILITLVDYVSTECAIKIIRNDGEALN